MIQQEKNFLWKLNKMMFDDEDRDKEILKKLKSKKKSFSQIVNKKNLDDFELDQALSEF